MFSTKIFNLKMTFIPLSEPPMMHPTRSNFDSRLAFGKYSIDTGLGDHDCACVTSPRPIIRHTTR